MKRLRISHFTKYKYSEEVFLEPQYLRFRPKVSPYLAIEEFNLELEPLPAGFSEQTDSENNITRLYWFEGSHREMSISVETVVQLTEYNPFNFLIYPAHFLELPYKYDHFSSQLLSPALNPIALSKPMQDFVIGTIEKTNHNTVQLLTELTRRIHEDFTLESRVVGAPFGASQTFDRKKGSCRDLAWMQIQLLRHVGIASRFVSGYFYLQSDISEFELHAWVEVFLPGAGWIGFDPSHGMITGTYHIPLASSAFYEHTMPVTGSLRGDAKSFMETTLNIEPIDNI